MAGGCVDDERDQTRQGHLFLGVDLGSREIKFVYVFCHARFLLLLYTLDIAAAGLLLLKKAGEVLGGRLGDTDAARAYELLYAILC